MAKKTHVRSCHHHSNGHRCSKHDKGESYGSPPYKSSESRRNRKTPTVDEPLVHIYNHGHECATDSVGYATPGDRSVTDLRVDAYNGFIPLWDYNVTLYYRYKKHTSEDNEAKVRELFRAALGKWGAAAPIRFKESDEMWDFEIVIRSADEEGTLAQAFFPDGGQHELVIYPLLFKQSRHEQVDTLIHELGHIFGLRHFFADISETYRPSKFWGTKDRFSIMEYEYDDTPGEDACLTENDTQDLTELYEQVWSKQLRDINGTPIVLFKPFHTHMP